ncbi:MAG: sialate O-acetylesterase [Candidatus Obscuribacterales bacterium]|nr:sialate O-acetylesterase [Candidatus Obscuribacterales bacterium]
MVLQQGCTIPIWGKAAPNELISVKLDQNTQTVNADGKGNFKVEFEPLSAGGPHSIGISVRSNTRDIKEIVIKDVMVGEVWLCSGQSNMALLVQELPGDQQKRIVNNLNANLRIMQIPPTLARGDAAQMKASWTKGSDIRTLNYAALPLCYGQKLQSNLNVPVGVITAAIPGSPLDVWIPSSHLRKVSPYSRVLQFRQANTPKEQITFLNGSACSLGFTYMISPILQFPIKGVLWYQGEANLGRAKEYASLFTLLIDSWRERWKLEQSDFPFVFIQLPGCKSLTETLGHGVWAQMREAQSKALEIRNVRQITSLDLGNAEQIHPPKKYELGVRAANQVAEAIYGKKLNSFGPQLKSADLEGNRVTLTFDHAGTGLFLIGKDCFELSGINSQFLPAHAEISANKVKVWSDQLDKPVLLRYCYSDYPESYLTNKTGVPAAPFQINLFAERRKLKTTQVPQ